MGVFLGRAIGAIRWEGWEQVGRFDVEDMGGGIAYQRGSPGGIGAGSGLRVGVSPDHPAGRLAGGAGTVIGLCARTGLG
jgi:hypothetical protein